MEKLSRLKFLLIAILCWLFGMGICFLGAVLNAHRGGGGGLFIFGMSFVGVGWIMGDCCSRRLNDIDCQTKWIRFVVHVFSFFYLIFPIVIVLAFFKSKKNTEESIEDSSPAAEKIKLGLCSPCRRALLIATFLYFLFGVGLIFYLNSEGWVFDTPQETAVPMYCIILLVLILFTFGVGQLMFYKPFKRLMLWVKTGK